MSSFIMRAAFALAATAALSGAAAAGPNSRYTHPAIINAIVYDELMDYNAENAQQTEFAAYHVLGFASWFHGECTVFEADTAKKVLSAYDRVRELSRKAGRTAAQQQQVDAVGTGIKDAKTFLAANGCSKPDARRAKSTLRHVFRTADEKAKARPASNS
jgi:hypothetical protein